MNNMPLKLRKQLADDPEYRRCARFIEGKCSGRITFEHALYWKGRQIQERFAIVPLCEFHHLKSGLDKRFNEWYAIRRMNRADRLRYPRVDWEGKLELLEKKFCNYYVR